MNNFNNSQHFLPSSLGPHQSEMRSRMRKEISKMKEETRREARKAFFSMHQVPNALIMIALLSFGANVAFGYLNFAGKGLSPESFSVPVFGASSNNDKNNKIEAPVLIASEHYSLIQNPAQLNVTAESYIVLDTDTGEILADKNENQQFPIASVTKLTTAIVAKQNIDPKHLATVEGESATSTTDVSGLVNGEKILVSDLYYPLLMESSNDAAEVLANDYGRDNFIQLMNQDAGDLSMSSTTYADPSGLSPNNVSTASDLAKLSMYIRKSYPGILDVTRVKQYSILNHIWNNSDDFLTYPNFLGGKNGSTNDAKQAGVEYFNVFFRGKSTNSTAINRPIAVIILKSADRDKDVSALLSYVSQNLNYSE